jgi:hypothetical protein
MIVFSGMFEASRTSVQSLIAVQRFAGVSQRRETRGEADRLKGPNRAVERRLMPAVRSTDSSSNWREAGILLISRAAATPTLRAYQSTLRAAGITCDLAFRSGSGAWIHVRIIPGAPPCAGAAGHK